MKGGTINTKTEDSIKETNEASKAELRSLTESIMEKLRFLSEGSPVISPVQVMGIQLQVCE